MTSGFIDGLKEVMGWLEKKYCYVIYIKGLKTNAALSAGREKPDFHTDLLSKELTTTRLGHQHYNMVMYMNLHSEQELKLKGPNLAEIPFP